MTRIGIHAAHELAAPATLLERMKAAERAGFRHASCSDHFHPWSEDQGHAGFAWAWLGAALQATSMSYGVVCAPGQRYHPAIVAQAAATLDQMYPGRFWLALGSGEALNEHITGEPWPEKSRRHGRLRECAEIMRRLWRGERVSFAGEITVADARLYVRPSTPPPILGAALTPETAEWLGGWADGLITAGNKTDDLKKIVEAFQRGGGEGKPLVLQSAVALGTNNRQALEAAHRYWRVAGLETTELANIPTPWEFDRRTASVRPEDLADRLRITASAQQLLEWLHEDARLGFEAVYLHPLGDEWELFLQVCSEKILPEFG